MFKKLIVGAALSLSTLAAAAPPAHPAMPLRGGAPEVRSDSFDVRQGHQLLRELDMVTARRDFRSVRMLDARIASFIRAELAEAHGEVRMERGRERREERQSARQLTRLLNDLQRVEGRMQPYAMAEKRRILVEAVNIAERDLRDARQDRFGRR